MLVTAILSGIVLFLLVTLIIMATRYSGQRKSLFDMIDRLDQDNQKKEYVISKIERTDELWKTLHKELHACFEKAQEKGNDYLNELNKYKFPESNALKYMQKISMEGSYCYFNYIDAGYVYLTNPEYCKQFGEAGRKISIVKFEEGLKACTILLVKD